MGKTEKSVRIGQKLRTLRDIRPRSGVARAIGISYNALANYECGMRVPPDDVKVKLADYYKVSIQDLFYSN